MAQLVETRHISASLDARHVHCGGPGWRPGDGAGWRFLPSVAGGCFELPPLDHGPRDRVLLWQLQTHKTSTLLLAEASAAHGQIGAAVSLEIDAHAFAGAALHADPSGGASLFLLLSDKCAARLALPRPPAAGERGRHASGGGAAAAGAAAGGSALDSVTPESLSLLHLAPHLGPLGAPAAIEVCAGHLVIAGASESVALVPLDAFDSGDAAATQLVPTSTSLLQRWVGSLYQPSARSGAVAALAARAAGGRPLLAVVTDSGALRLVAPPPGASPLAAHELLPGAGARRLAPRAAVAAGGVPDGELLIVSQLESPGAPGASTLAATHVLLGDGAAATLAAPAAVASRHALQLPAAGARLLGARVAGGALHVLAGMPGGETALLAFDLRDGSYLGAAQLLSRGPGPEWGAPQDIWAAALAAFPEATNPEDAVASQILVPGALCRGSLRDALAFWGAALGREQVEAASYDQLRVYLRAALLSVSARHPSFTEAQCWHALLSRYCEAWAQRHPPLGLAAAAGGAWLGVARGGPAMTLLRPATRLEAEAEGAGAAGGAGGALDARARAAVRACAQAAGGALGAPALRLMMRLAAAGVDLEGSLLPGFVDLLLFGPQAPAGGGGGAGGGGARGGAGARVAEWRAARQAALLAVQQALAEVEDPIGAISAYVDELLLPPEAPAGPSNERLAGAPAAPPLPPALGAALCSAALQAARARCLAAQKLLLVLGVLLRTGRAGGAPLSPADRARITDHLQPRLLSALRGAAMALWLAKTPAAAPPGPGGGGGGGAAAALPQHLEALQLGGGRGGGGSPGATPRTPGGAAAPQPQPRAGRGAGELPLASHLLRGFAASRPAEAAAAAAGRAGPAAAALLDYLISGGGGGGDDDISTGGDVLSAGAAGAGAVDALLESDEAMAGGVRTVDGAGGAGGGNPGGSEARALRAGWQLFKAREFAGACALAELAGGRAPADPGLAFLLGVGLACRLRGFGGPGPAGDAARAELLDAASGHLFRAAAGLAAPGAAPLRGVLRQLRGRQRAGSGGGGGEISAAGNGGGGGSASMDLSLPAGGGGGEVVAPEVVPRLRLEFFEAVMRLFESEECLEGALAFARAALGAVGDAYDSADPARRERQGALWMSVFTYASRLGRHADAYAAAVANPSPRRRLECVKRLVHRLAEERRLDALCALPFAGAVTPEPSAADPAPAPVPLVAAAAEVLTRRALHSALGGGAGGGRGRRGGAHAALSAFLVCWGDYRGAAAAMLALAWRLRAEAPRGEDTVQEVEDAYAAALNNLELLDPADAWLDTSHPLLADCAPPAAPGAPSGGAAGEGDEDEGAAEEEDAAAAAAADDGMDEGEGGGGGGGGAAAGAAEHAAAAARRLRRRAGGAGAPGVVALGALRREAALFTAAAALAPALPGLDVLRPAPGLAPDYIFDQTLGTGRLEDAASLAHAAWRGGALEERLERLAAAAGAACARAQAGGGGGGSGGAAAGGGLGGGGGAACARLRALVERYEAAGRARLAGRLRAAAADAALAESPAGALPPWLVEPFSPPPGGGAGMAGGAADPAALLRVYLRHGRLEDAASLALAHLAAWQAAGPLARCRPTSNWVPLRTLELLDARLADAAQNPSGDQRGGGKGAAALAALGAALRGAVGEHLQLGARDSQMAAAAAGGGGGGAAGMALG